MSPTEFLTFDADLLDDCMRDLPSSDAEFDLREKRVAQCLQFFLSERITMYVDRAWKGMDDNEAWAA